MLTFSILTTFGRCIFILCVGWNSFTDINIKIVAVSDIVKKTKSDETNVFFVFLRVIILAIDELTLKNISGITIVKVKFINISPNGKNILAFSLNTIPTDIPNIIEDRSIRVDFRFLLN